MNTMLFGLYVIAILISALDGKKTNNYGMIKRLSRSDPAHQLLWRNYNNYYYIDNDNNDDYYYADNYYDEEYYEEEEMELGLAQMWFDFKMHFAERIVLSYLVGAKTKVKDAFEDRWKKFETAIDEFKASRLGGILTMLKPVEKLGNKLKDWAKSISGTVVEKLTSAFQQIVIAGYNTAKESMAKKSSLEFKRFEPTERQLAKIPESEKERNPIKKFIQQMAFDKAVKFINSKFVTSLNNFEKELKEQAAELIEKYITNNVPVYKEWIDTKLKEIFSELVATVKTQAYGVFEHAKQAIAVGADLKYKEQLNIKEQLKEHATHSARIEYLNMRLAALEDVFYDEQYSN